MKRTRKISIVLMSAMSVLVIVALILPLGKAVMVRASNDIISIATGLAGKWDMSKYIDPDKQPPPDTDAPSVSFTPIVVVKNGVPVLTKYDNYVLQSGLWYDEYTRIYTVGGKNRVIEISNYPRAYKDTALHVYTVDTNFRVAEADLNYYDEKGGRWYQDSKGGITKLGQWATHYAGESLPGAFPTWLEYTSLQPVSKDGTFVNIQNIISDIYPKSGVLLASDGKMVSLTGKEVNVMIASMASKANDIAIGKGTGRQILYIFLVRKFYDGN